jgi:hypothetical protein
MRRLRADWAQGRKLPGRARLLARQAPALQKGVCSVAFPDRLAEFADFVLVKRRQAVHRLQVGVELLVPAHTGV